MHHTLCLDKIATTGPSTQSRSRPGISRIQAIAEQYSSIAIAWRFCTRTAGPGAKRKGGGIHHDYSSKTTQDDITNLLQLRRRDRSIVEKRLRVISVATRYNTRRGIIRVAVKEGLPDTRRPMAHTQSCQPRPQTCPDLPRHPTRSGHT